MFEIFELKLINRKSYSIRIEEEKGKEKIKCEFYIIVIIQFTNSIISYSSFFHSRFEKLISNLIFYKNHRRNKFYKFFFSYRLERVIQPGTRAAT